MSHHDKYWTGTIWITGLSASGKTTFGLQLREALISEGIRNVELLDGEELRKSLGKSYGFSTEERSAFALDIGQLAQECNERGNIAIVCAISHVREIRLKIRKQIARFTEVYLSCPVEVCAGRDYKGHYRKAFSGVYDNFIGVTEPYQLSDQPDLILDTANGTKEHCSKVLLEHVLAFLRSVNGAAARRDREGQAAG